MAKSKNYNTSNKDDVQEVIGVETPKKPSGKRWKVIPLVPSAKKACIHGNLIGEGWVITDENDSRWGKINGLARIKMVKVEVMK